MVIQDALYNVVRPQKFSEVVGQTNTIKAIKTALTKGVLEHSLIFYGQTGGGKTTTARIVAKWLQCDSKVDNEPCCQCETCKAIKAETFADYVELNASTNGGKDDIDRLLENISFAPQYGKCKVYVIDEAHCLTDGAWKSLLKPLEEPPSHVYFILCTTDFQSIPQTIKNRCGKYEFSRITKADILGLLGDLRIKYKAAYTDEALGLLAESADGSLRNAVNNFSHISMPFEEGEEIGEDSVKKYLALVGPETMAEYVGALVKKDLGRALSIIHEEEESAVNPDNFLKMILNAISDALTVSCNAALNREVSEEYMKTLKEISSYGMIRLSGVAGKLNEQYSKLTCRNYSSLRITSAEICMLSTGSGDSELINELLARIADLEQRNCAALHMNRNHSVRVLLKDPCRQKAGKKSRVSQIPDRQIMKNLWNSHLILLGQKILTMRKIHSLMSRIWKKALYQIMMQYLEKIYRRKCLCQIVNLKRSYHSLTAFLTQKNPQRKMMRKELKRRMVAWQRQS